MESRLPKRDIWLNVDPFCASCLRMRNFKFEGGVEMPFWFSETNKMVAMDFANKLLIRKQAKCFK